MSDHHQELAHYLSQDFFKNLLNRLDDGFFLIDAEKKILFANRVLYETLGYSEGELANQPFPTLLSQDESQLKTWSTFQADLRKEGFAVGLFLFARKDGTPLTGKIKATATSDGSSEWMGFFRLRSFPEETIEFQDVTIQFLSVTSELAKYISESLPLHTMLERFMNVPMLHLDLSGGGIYLLDKNRNAALLEVSRNLNERFVQAVQRIDLELEFIQEILRQPRAMPLVDVLSPGLKLTELIHVLGYQNVLFVPLFFKESLLGFLQLIPHKSFSDFERTQIESLGSQIALAISNAHLIRDLRESEQKYSMVIDSASDGIMITQDGVFKFVNKHLADMVKRTITEMIGIDITQTMDPRYTDDLVRRYEERISGKVPREMYEGALLSKSGNSIPVEFNASRIQYEGRPASLSFVRDISRRIALKNQVVEQKEMAEFYNDVLTHDIQNFCHTMLGNLDLLMADLQESVQPGRLDNLKACQHSVQKVSRLIDRVRELMNIQIVQPENLSPLSLKNLIAEAIEIAHESFPQQTLSIKSSVSKDAYILGTNLVLLVFVNLLTNAVKHNDRSDKQVEIQVHSTTLHHRPAWRIDVADNGPGIEPQFRERIFERFQGFSKRKGKGLGLSIVQAMVKKLSGEIIVINEGSPIHLGGSTMRIVLPKA